ncbi:MAG: 50S ribosomal protein L21 [Sphingomicrobium sp.]
MFAVVRTGGKQYRVAAGDKIVVEKLDGEAGQRIDITDVLLAGEGSELRSVEGLIVGAEIVAQAKADKVTVFKKRRRHNYRRKKGHRQQHTILRIVSIGDNKEDKKPKAAAKPVPSKAEGAPKAETAPVAAADAPADVSVTPTENPAPKPKKAPKAETGSTKKAAPAKGAPKKAPKAK